jgi:hypothetical protein
VTRRTKKQRATIAKRIAVIGAIGLILTFTVKEIVKENLKDLHDSLAQAENRFRTENGQSMLSIQNLNIQEQLENLGLQADTMSGKTDSDYGVLIAQDTSIANQALAQLNSDFDSVSRLIDALPSWAKGLQQSREQIRDSVTRTNGQVRQMLEPKPERNAARLVQVKLAAVIALVGNLPVTVLGDAALTAARELQEISEKLIRVCSLLFYIFSLMLLGLGLYAAMNGFRSDTSE